MSLNLNIHKFSIILAEYRRGEKFSPQLKQVINRSMQVF